MFLTDTRKLSQTREKPNCIHGLWAQAGVEQPSTLRMDAVLRMLRTHFDVDSAIITLEDKDNKVVKVQSGADPLEMDYRNALKACAGGDAEIFVIEDIEPGEKTADSEQEALRFYAGASIVISPRGSPVGTLSLMATQPRAFSQMDRNVLESAALAISAMMVMPHNAAIAQKIALAAAKSVVVIDHNQAIEAVNQRFTELTNFAYHDVQRMGVAQLLCLDRQHAGAVVLSHALLVETAKQGMTRCVTKSGSTIPVEVMLFPMPDKRGNISKTILLMAPLLKGRTDDFLLSLRPTERDELLALHIAGLWSTDAQGRILKLTGAPIAHLDVSEHERLLGQRLDSAGVFDTSLHTWREFYAYLAADKPPPEVECCVTFKGHAQWYGMKGFRQTDASGKTVGYHGSFRDITDRKLRELSLRQSEERLSLVLKGTNDGAWDWDMETGQYYLSPRWWDMMGRTPDASPTRDEIWLDFIHPDDRAGVRAALRDAVADGRDNYQMEFRMLHQRGHYFSVLGRGHILYNSEGKAVRTAGTNFDLTQQRQAQSQIRLLQSCVDVIDDVVLISAASPTQSPGPFIVYVNPAFERHTGYTSAEVIGKTPRLLQGPLTSRTELKKIAIALKEWRSVKVELANYKKNGELFWVELEITPVYAEGSTLCTHWIGVQRIITERKIAEQALRLSNQRLNMAMEASGLGFWTRHVARGESYRDERWHAMLGYPPQKVSTKPDEWLKLVHPDDLAVIEASDTEEVLRLDATFEREFRMRHSDGRWVWIQARCKVIERDAFGKPTKIAGTHMDISGKVEARQITERLNAQLSRCLEHVNVGVMLQRDGIIKFVNSTLLRIFGATEHSVIVGTKFSNYILPSDLKDAAWRQSQLYAGAGVPSFWFSCVHLDGHTFKALTNSVVIEWEGEPHILSTMTPPGDIALLTLEAETNRSRYDTLLVKRVEAEQVRIAQELHDSLGSQLAGIGLHAANIKLLAESGNPLTQEANEMLAQIKKAAAITRSLARGLAPVDAWPGAFWPALEKLCADFSVSKQVQCIFQMQGNFDAVAAETGTHLYRIAQEAISNALHHGGATHVSVSLSATQDQMTLRVQDDGVGFDAAGFVGTHGSGLGLSSMYARAKTIDGKVTLERISPRGFCVAVSWPNASPQQTLASS